jgi:sulfopyruvate decarboxylase subunit beta
MATGDKIGRGMPAVAGLQVLVDLRQREQIVITNQASARAWPKLCDHPLDFHYNPSTMGGAIPLGLGLALAQPGRHVLVVSGEGALLMNLGTLITVVGAGAANLTIVVMDNGMYEVTGGQKTAATETAVDLPALVRAAGFPSVASFQNLADWQARAASVLRLPGPRFISLVVQRTPQEYFLGATRPIADQIRRFRDALAQPA